VSGFPAVASNQNIRELEGEGRKSQMEEIKKRIGLRE